MVRAAAAAAAPYMKRKKCSARTWFGTSGVSAVSTATNHWTLPTSTMAPTERSTAKAATVETMARAVSDTASEPERLQWCKPHVPIKDRFVDFLFFYFYFYL